MNKQTAIQWLIQQLDWKKSMYLTTHKIIDQAIQMEREQIVKVWNDGNYNYFYNRVGRKEFEDGNEYYNETYGGNNE
jgi:hypothetical protein